MKENVLDVLVYLFDHYVTDVGLLTDENTLTGELEEAGFELNEIHKAFDWLETLYEMTEYTSHAMPTSQQAIRLYTAEETDKLSPECFGLLHHFEQRKLLCPIIREIVMDRAMAIESSTLDLEQFKQVFSLVLLNYPDYDERIQAMADSLDDTYRPLCLN